ncbi:MAG: hypothetical protein ACRD2X_01830 [Vicinamibacteraceae bacterium]
MMRPCQRFLYVPLLAALAHLSAPVASHAESITFDELLAPTLFADAEALTGRYADLGVIFGGTGAILDQASDLGVSGFSPRNFLAYEEFGFIGPPGSGQRTSVASDSLFFSTPRRGISFAAGSGQAGNTLHVRAFDNLGALVASTSLGLTPMLQQISLTGPGIRRVEYGLLDVDLGDTLVVDNVSVTSVPEPGPALLLGTGVLAIGMGRLMTRRLLKQRS